MADAKLEREIASLQFSADDGNSEAMFLLGVAYAQGRGIEKNDASAAKWFNQAARKGHSRARTSMGYLYSIGRGVKPDPILGYMFVAQALAEGDVLAKDMLTKLRKKMTEAQIAEAEKRLNSRTTGT